MTDTYIIQEGTLAASSRATNDTKQKYNIKIHSTLPDFPYFVSWTWLEGAEERVNEQSNPTEGNLLLG